MPTMDDSTGDALLQFGEDVVRLAAPLADAVRSAVAAGTSIHLEVPEHLRKDFVGGSLEYLEKTSGERTAILVRTDGKKMAGHANVTSDGVSLLTPDMAWKLMAVATQQKYLHDINAQLSGIAGGIAGLHARLQHAVVGELLAIERALDERRGALEAGVDLDPTAMSEAKGWLVKVDSIREAALLEVRAATKDVAAAGTRKALLAAAELLGGRPAREFDIALAATHLRFAIRAHTLEIATGTKELHHLIERGSLEHRAAIAELKAAALPFETTLRRATTKLDTPELTDKLAKIARVPGDAAAKPFKRLGKGAAPAGVGAGAAAGGAAGGAAAAAAAAAGFGGGFAGLGASAGAMGALAAAGLQPLPQRSPPRSRRGSWRAASSERSTTAMTTRGTRHSSTSRRRPPAPSERRRSRPRSRLSTSSRSRAAREPS